MVASLLDAADDEIELSEWLGLKYYPTRFGFLLRMQMGDSGVWNMNPVPSLDVLSVF